MLKQTSSQASWAKALRVYLDPRVLSMMFLGFSSGLPFGVLAEPLTAWLSDAGVQKTEIGLFALVSIPYSLKFLWAPIMDRVSLPVLTRVFGRRRSWVLLTQGLLFFSIIQLGATNPNEGLWWVAVFALLVSFASASQDIVIDAYRVEILEEKQLAAGAALAINGWRLSSWGGAALALMFADLMSWQVVFLCLSVATGVGVLAILLNPEPSKKISDNIVVIENRARLELKKRKYISDQTADLFVWIYSSVFCPFIEFIARPN